MGRYRRFEFHDLAKISRASRHAKGAVCKGQGREKAITAYWLATSTSCRANMRTLTGWQPARTPGRILAGNQHVLRASMRSLIRWQPGRPQGAHAFAYWLATSTSFRANMRSLTGWQRAPLVGRRCVRRQTYADVFRRIQTYADVLLQSTNRSIWGVRKSLP